jgi:hypothetical protein
MFLNHTIILLDKLLLFAARKRGMNVTRFALIPPGAYGVFSAVLV